MTIEVSEHSLEVLDVYAAMPIAFEVKTTLDVADAGGTFVLTERPLRSPFWKDYDAIEGQHPGSWQSRLDSSTCALFLAHVNGQHVGGSIVSTDAALIDSSDAHLSVLWDIRVAHQVRRQGVGAALFKAAEEWSRSKACRVLQVETQNINVAACRFYDRQRCVLVHVERFAYPTLPDEIKLVWEKQL